MKGRSLTIALGIAALFSLTVCGQTLDFSKFYSHRGGSYEFDENTLSAFQGSYEKGSRGFETDIRMTKDGELVISHDASLERMTTSKGIIEEMRASELRNVKTKKGHPFLFLDDILAFFSNKPSVYLEFEMKTTDLKAYPDDSIPVYCEKVYKRVSEMKPATSTYLFTSFDKRPLRYLKEHHPDADLLLISGNPCSRETVHEALDLGIRRVGCTIGGTTRANVNDAHKDGMIVTLWPTNNIKDYLLGISLGADRVCTDIPLQVMDWLTEHSLK